QGGRIPKAVAARNHAAPGAHQLIGLVVDVAHWTPTRKRQRSRPSHAKLRNARFSRIAREWLQQRYATLARGEEWTLQMNSAAADVGGPVRHFGILTGERAPLGRGRFG